MKGEVELERLYRAAAREIRARVLAVDPLTLTGVQADELRAFARRIARVLDLGVVEWAERYLPASADIAARRTRVALEILGRRPRRPEIDRPERDTIDRTVADLAMANASIPQVIGEYLDLALLAGQKARAAQVQEFSREEILRQVAALAAEAVLKEQSRGWLQARIREILQSLIDDDGFLRIVCRDGVARMFKATKYARMVARTALRDAQTKAALDLCRQYENDLVQVSDHATICDECIPFEGQVYSISGKHPKYPRLEESPPYHPNCKHSLLATSDVEIDIRAEEGWRPYA